MKNLVAMVVAFAAGALLMIGLRGAGTSHADGLPPHGEGHGAHGAPASEAAPAQAPADPTAHAGHVAQAPRAPQAPPAADAPSTTVELWVCAQDARYALSWEGDCPLDGKPMVKKTVERSTLKDLKNERCPIMGGKTPGNVYAVYDGTMVHFCCPGCDTKFFKAPAEHIEKLTSGKQ